MAPETLSTSSLPPTAKIRVPQHVVYRVFPTETVVLNLQTGRYHGLNTSAGQMLETLERASSLAEAVALIAQRYDKPTALVEQDMRALCQSMLDRGLIQIDAGASS